MAGSLHGRVPAERSAIGRITDDIRGRRECGGTENRSTAERGMNVWMQLQCACKVCAGWAGPGERVLEKRGARRVRRSWQARNVLPLAKYMACTSDVL